MSLLKAGEAPYYKTGQTMGIPGGDTENRWGDFSATVIDPTDDVTFWTLQEYAQTPDPITGASRWGTWWGTFHPSDVLPPTGLTATADNATQVTLNWTDPATNETGYVVERKVGAAGTFGVLTSPPLPPNSVTYTDTAGLVAGTTYFYRVGAVGSTGTSYSIEASVTTPGSPPPSEEAVAAVAADAFPSPDPEARCRSARRSSPPEFSSCPRARSGCVVFSVGAQQTCPDPAPPLLRKGETRRRGR